MLIKNGKPQKVFHTFKYDADPRQRFTIEHGASVSTIANAYANGWPTETKMVIVELRKRKDNLHREDGISKSGNSGLDFMIPATLQQALDLARPGWEKSEKDVQELLHYCKIFTPKG